MDYLSKFAERLDYLMFEQNITPEILSERVFIDASGIRRYLRKESFPLLINAIAIANYFKCPLDYLFGFISDYYPTEYKENLHFTVILQSLLSDNNLSRRKFAEKLKISDRTMLDWFNGKRTPKIETLIEIAKYFNCSLDYLVGRE